VALNISPSSSPVYSSSPLAESNTGQQISSGSAINSAADDAAGLSIASRMDAALSGKRMAMRNAADGMSYAETANGALETLAGNVSRIRELAVQAGNGVLNDDDRMAIQAEITALNDENSQLMGQASFNGQPLFSREEALSFQVGEGAGDTVEVPAPALNELDSQSGNALTASAAQSLIQATDDDLQALSASMADNGVLMNRFSSTMDALASSISNDAESLSRIQDTDIAEAASRRAGEQVREQVQIAVQAQANLRGEDVLRLLG
tara:strand:- start:19651 stop:20445 length:795 start_codon:yes stop_codon:yes gene_type:complete